MNKQKVGKGLFWMAVIWAVLWGVIGSVFCSSAMNSMTMEELNESTWAMTGSLMFLWGVGGVPLGAIMAGIGILLYSGAKGSTVWKFVIGIILLGPIIATAVGFLGHVPLLFGIGGTLILLFFIGIIWFWGKERMALKETSTAAADLKLIGYVFMLMAAWFICGIASQPFLKAFEGEAPSNPIMVMIFLVLGWFFLFLSHRKSVKQ